MKFRSKFNHGFINPGCLHCAILKACKGHAIFPSKCSKWDFQDFENVFNYNMKFTRTDCWINLKISNWGKIPHSWYSYFVTIVGNCCDVFIESL